MCRKRRESRRSDGNDDLRSASISDDRDETSRHHGSSSIIDITVHQLTAHTDLIRPVHRASESFFVVFVVSIETEPLSRSPGSTQTTHAALILISITGTRPDKWHLLKSVVDLSDLRRQQITRKWQTNERSAITCRVRLRHCIRRKDY